MAKTRKQPTYEEAVANLETIIEKIESGEIGLEESLKHYEEGMKLLGRCREVLDTAEKKIATLAIEAAKVSGDAAAPSAEGSEAESDEDDSVVAELDEKSADDDDLPF